MRTFAFAAASLVVFAHLLPEAVAEIGFPALVVFGVSLALPSLLERLAHARHGQAHRHGEHADDHAPGLEIGYLGLLLHNFGDGLGIGALPSSWARTEIALSVGAHTIPVVAIFVVAFASQRSPRAALVRAVFLALAIAAGMLAASLVPESLSGTLEPWITAAIAGVLLHVIAHDWPADPAPDALSRALDLVAIAAAIALSLVQTESGIEAHAGAEVPGRLAVAMARLALRLGPPLLAGLAASAALQAWRDGSRRARHPASTASPAREAAGGVALAIVEPGAAPHALVTAESIRRTTGSAGRAVAFATGVRGLGAETVLASATLLGLRWSLARLLGTAIVAFAAGRLAAAAASSGEAAEADSGPPRIGSGLEPANAIDSFGLRFVGHLDELVAHVGAWTIVGLLAACYVELSLPAAGFGRSTPALVVAWLTAVAAAAAWVGSVAATPLAAVLVHAGWSRAAALAALLLGPTIGLAGSRWIRDRIGRRATWATTAAMLVAAAAWSISVDSAGFLTRSTDPILLPPPSGGIATASVAALCALLARSVWQSGLRNWLARLAEAPGIGPTGPEGHSDGPHAGSGDGHVRAVASADHRHRHPHG